MENNFNKSLSENILTLLVFSNENASIIVNTIKVEYFENIYYRTIAGKSISFYKSYNEPPKEHIADLLDKELLGESGEIYKKIIKSLFTNKDSINAKYIISELEKFIRRQNIKLAVSKAVELLQKDDIDSAENILEKARNNRISLFDPGTWFLKDVTTSLDFLGREENELIYTGIKHFDELEICPARRELFCFVARAGAGKSWFLVHLAKYALLQGKKVLHISLELSEDKLKQRYLQTFFGMASNAQLLNKNNKISIFNVDTYGNLLSIDSKDLIDTKTLKDDNIIDFLNEKILMFRKPELILKEFPTGTLSVKGLNAYLDNLESYYNFIPDIILLDYLDLMDIDVERLRIDLGQTAIALRGIAGERNLAMVTVAQTNKSAEGQALLTRKYLAEDFSKVRVADNLITYNQTMHEGNRARLFVDKARNSITNTLILISQNYSIGQFCLGSAKINMKNYIKVINEMGDLAMEDFKKPTEPTKNGKK